jgi:hypothetical protein
MGVRAQGWGSGTVRKISMSKTGAVSGSRIVMKNQPIAYSGRKIPPC